MTDFIRMFSDLFDLLSDVVTSFFHSISTFCIALSNIYFGLSGSIQVFPTFLGGLMLSCFCCLVLLRILGR